MRRKGWFCAVGLAGVLSVVAHGESAWADEDPEALIRQGNQLRQRGDNERAHGYFKRAYEIAHTGRTAAQLGLVEMAIQRFVDAELHLTEALNSSDAWVEDNRKQLEQTRDRGRTHLGRVEIRGAPTGTTIQIEERPPVRVPADGVLWASPGQTTLTFAPPGGRKLAKQAVVSLGASVSVDLGLPAPEPTFHPEATSAGPSPPKREVTPPEQTVSNALKSPPAAPASAAHLRAAAGPGEPSHQRAVRIAGLATASAGVATGAAGLLLLRWGNAKVDAIDADAGGPRPFNESNGNYKTLQYSGVALMVTGGAAVTTGLILYLLNREDRSESANSTVSFGLSPNGGVGFQIAGRLP